MSVFEGARTARSFSMRGTVKTRLTKRPQEDSLPKINKTTHSTNFGIEDFYLTSLTQQIVVSSRKYEKVKSQCMESLMKQTNKSVSTMAQTSSNPYPQNLLMTNSIISKQEQRPSYGSYPDTLPLDVKVLFKDSLAMERLFKSFDTSFYCMEEVCSLD